MLIISNEACYNHAKYLESLYINNEINKLLAEANNASKYLRSIDINRYDDLYNLKLVVTSYIMYPLIYLKFISSSILIKLSNLNTKLDILNLLNSIII